DRALCGRRSARALGVVAAAACEGSSPGTDLVAVPGHRPGGPRRRCCSDGRVPGAAAGAAGQCGAVAASVPRPGHSRARSSLSQAGAPPIAAGKGKAGLREGRTGDGPLVQSGGSIMDDDENLLDFAPGLFVVVLPVWVVMPQSCRTASSRTATPGNATPL